MTNKLKHEIKKYNIGNYLQNTTMMMMILCKSVWSRKNTFSIQQL
jgi:hypothetical protein